jgi:hypothetical protein
MKVMIATPVYQDMCHVRMAQSVSALQGALHQRGDQVKWVTISATYVQVGRDLLVDVFLESDFDRLFFIDSDIVFHPSQAIELLKHDVDIIAGLYPCKDIYWPGIQATAKHVGPKMLEHIHAKNMVFRIPEEKTKPIGNPLEPIKVTGAATGFMVIKRKVFEIYKDAYEDRTYEWNQKRIQQFFQLGYIEEDGDRKLWGEDIYFCEIARRLGFQCWVIPAVNVAHMGQHAFQGCYWCCQGQVIHNIQEDD